MFLNIGRIHPADLQEVYLCFNNNLIDQPRTVVALREITHFGGIVSPEAARVERHYNPTINIEQKNKSAAMKFFQNLVRGPDFHPLFARFLQNSYTNILNFHTDLLYPGENAYLSSKFR